MKPFKASFFSFIVRFTTNTNASFELGLFETPRGNRSLRVCQVASHESFFGMSRWYLGSMDYFTLEVGWTSPKIGEINQLPK